VRHLFKLRQKCSLVDKRHTIYARSVIPSWEWQELQGETFDFSPENGFEHLGGGKSCRVRHLTFHLKHFHLKKGLSKWGGGRKHSTLYIETGLIYTNLCKNILLIVAQ
jgi:hypothetical protein